MVSDDFTLEFLVCLGALPSGEGVRPGMLTRSVATDGRPEGRRGNRELAAF